jgi:tRNA nucleotidyltransferase/poly(A) polymerase
MKIPEKVLTILNKLESNGYEAYIVGGAVRDMQMGIEPTDWDIATDATPAEILETFMHLTKAKLIGAESFPVVDVDGIDVATFREDVYDDDREFDPHLFQSYKIIKSILNDLKRRDFTINAMAMSATGTVIDPYGGMMDIEDRVIRFVGNPVDRINEDPNRMIRACRFLALLDGEFDHETYIALHNAALYADHTVAPERIRKEILKAMAYPNASTFFFGLYTVELLDGIFPSLAACYEADHGQYHDEDIFQHMMITGDAIPDCIDKVYQGKTKHAMGESSPLLKLAGYLHDVGKSEPNFKDGVIHFYDHEVKGAEILKGELKALTFSTAEIKFITNLVLVHMRGSAKMSPKTTRKVIKKFVELDVVWRDWLVLKTADRVGNIRRQKEQPLKVTKIAKKFIHELEDVPYEKGPRDPNNPQKGCFEHNWAESVCRGRIGLPFETGNR